MTCGVGDVCEMSGLALMAQDGIIYTPDMKPDLSKQPEVFEKKPPRSLRPSLR